MYEQNMAYLYNGTLFGNKRERRTNACYNMNKPQKYYARRKKKQTHKELILYDFIYIEFPEKANI